MTQPCDTIRIAIKNETKQTRGGTIATGNVLHSPNSSSRDLGFCSLYSLLCFDYGVYDEVMMNLRMNTTIHF